MNNKLRNIQLVNILLEQKYLREQTNTQTGTTNTQSGTTSTTGATQTSGNTTAKQNIVTTQPSPTQRKSLSDTEKQKLDKEIKDGKIMKCVGSPTPYGSTSKYKIYKLSDGKTFCYG
jgi:hypothetical protein